MEKNTSKEYELFQIPTFESETVGSKKKLIIGLIDASGSMSSFWPSLVKFWN
jgi:Mg-chelatase subunit ChlD